MLVNRTTILLTAVLHILYYFLFLPIQCKKMTLLQTCLKHDNLHITSAVLYLLHKSVLYAVSDCALSQFMHTALLHACFHRVQNIF